MRFLPVDRIVARFVSHTGPRAGLELLAMAESALHGVRDVPTTPAGFDGRRERVWICKRTCPLVGSRAKGRKARLPDGGVATSAAPLRMRLRGGATVTRSGLPITAMPAPRRGRTLPMSVPPRRR